MPQGDESNEQLLERVAKLEEELRERDAASEEASDEAAAASATARVGSERPDMYRGGAGPPQPQAVSASTGVAGGRDTQSTDAVVCIEQPPVSVTNDQGYNVLRIGSTNLQPRGVMRGSKADGEVLLVAVMLHRSTPTTACIERLPVSVADHRGCSVLRIAYTNPQPPGVIRG